MAAPYQHAQAQGVDLADGFETAPLDQKRWSLRRAKLKRYWIDRNTVHSGKGALALRVKGNDFSDDCRCQQNEVREAAARRMNFGEEAWYAFSFRVRGNSALTGSQRWVIGGWKQETNGSAFLAQRFDRGVFHITLESGQTRVLLATAHEQAKGFVELLKTGIGTQFGFVSDPDRYRGNSDLEIEYGADPVLPDPALDWVDMVYRVRGGLNRNGLVEVYANGKMIARVQGTIGVEQMAGKTQYFKIGHNRAPMPGTATLYLDDFRRGATKAAVTNVQP